MGFAIKYRREMDAGHIMRHCRIAFPTRYWDIPSRLFLSSPGSRANFGNEENRFPGKPKGGCYVERQEESARV